MERGNRSASLLAIAVVLLLGLPASARATAGDRPWMRDRDLARFTSSLHEAVGERVLKQVRFGEGESVAYFPYGEVWRDQGRSPTEYRFTSKPYDAETGLMYFGARYYAPGFGRWISADPVITAEPGLTVRRPDLLSAYGYARRSPLVYVDPDGRCDVSADGLLDCAGPGRRLAQEGSAQVRMGLKNESLSDLYAGEAKYLGGTLSQTAGLALDMTVAFAWNAGIKYGSGVDTLVKSGGADSGTLLEGSVDALAIALGGKMSGTKPGPVSVTAATSGVRGSSAAYEAAVAEGRHAGTLRNYAGRPLVQIQRGIAGYERQVALHAEKIANPARFAERWGRMGAQEQAGLVAKWQRDLARNQELADVLRGLADSLR